MNIRSYNNKKYYNCERVVREYFSFLRLSRFIRINFISNNDYIREWQN